MRDRDHEAVLRRALAERRNGKIPLIGDERWREQRWRELLRRVDRCNAGSHQPDASDGARADVVDGARAALDPRAEWAALTSGSTGEPRIILRSEQSWREAYPALDRMAGITADDTMLIPVHPVSSMAPFAAFHAESSGFEFRTPATHRITEADLRGVSLLHGTPWHLRDALDLIDAGCRTPLRAAFVGGDRLPGELRRRAEAAGLTVLSYYGAAELSMVAIDQGGGLRPFPGVEIEVRDGQIWVDTPQRAVQTLGGPGSLRSDGRWVTVGDRGRLHGGLLSVEGRDDDAILTAGATVIPARVEDALTSIPGVRASLVVGLPNERAGAVVAAALEIEPSGSSTDVLPRIKARARELLDDAHLPRRWVLVPELPRTGSGKVKRLSADEFSALGGPDEADSLETDPARRRGRA